MWLPNTESIATGDSEKDTFIMSFRFFFLFSLLISSSIPYDFIHIFILKLLFVCLSAQYFPSLYTYFPSCSSSSFKVYSNLESLASFQFSLLPIHRLFSDDETLRVLVWGELNDKRQFPGVTVRSLSDIFTLLPKLRLEKTQGLF